MWAAVAQWAAVNQANLLTEVSPAEGSNQKGKNDSPDLQILAGLIKKHLSTSTKEDLFL